MLCKNTKAKRLTYTKYINNASFPSTKATRLSCFFLLLLGKRCITAKINFFISMFFGSCQFLYTSTNTSQHESTRAQHESTRIKKNLTRVNTSPTRVNTNQHESKTSQHESDTSQHESTQVKKCPRKVNMIQHKSDTSLTQS